MIILDQPYVSPLLAETCIRNDMPVWVHRDVHIPYADRMHLLDHQELPESLDGKPLLTNAESCLSLLEDHFPRSDYRRWSASLKNKQQFRKICRALEPDHFFQTCTVSRLPDLDPALLPLPVVIKPVTGYSSIGVYIVHDEAEWPEAVRRITSDMSHARHMYAESVVSSQTVLIEQWIRGTEYALDGFYNKDSEPVILNIFKRMFVDERDTSDRIYYTSRFVMEEVYEQTMAFLRDFAAQEGYKRFPFHLEFRLCEGRLRPIEMNPLRFAGIGTTDLGYYAHGVNPYHFYWHDIQPDWEKRLSAMGDHVYSFFCAERPLSVTPERIRRIEHDRFKQQFGHILAYRRLDSAWDKAFAVVFCKSGDLQENRRLLHLDVQQYLQLEAHHILG